MHHRLIRNLDYVWRLEAGSKLTCVIEKDIFAEFQEKNLKYGFAMAMKEFHETVTDFWELTTKPDLIRNDDKSYNLCHFWTNFEIMHIPSFQSISYKEFSDFVDATGLIYTSRLSDGPIRTIGVMRNFKTNEIAHLSDFGYIHTSHSFCPVLDRCYCKDGSMNECTDAFSKEFVKYSNE
ncbi:nucleotide-diphospho-sugar transferase [Rozella allomycis CSF55]|uniref:Glycosyl transferase, family 15 domain-containing protein n=1 Tax=Rozella allomycis (strain CSF55) TaxID=988480 RepID=A0A075B1I5_ROZAC|nr:Glycosyl transferase, family 15 domain-containing protein [Rozella allomycis CSF55]RKP21564.1 nucleotide-diphospho-sugar transferase [Rozella allomycis CSF55]|eukprot:EPZ34643.1 Glycosyl transferase, family 15 domain-containing protein [Rozella allomycis CSF55]